jgi:adenosine deaminase
MIDVTLPLIDLHRHLEGSVRIETILDLGRRYDLPLPAWEVDNLSLYFQVMDNQLCVMAFIEKK